MRVVVINLEKNKERLNNISKQLNNLNVKFERFNAVYGKDLSYEEIKEKTTFECHEFLCNKSMIGCALSHINVWRDFFNNSDEQFLCVLEDDADLNNEFPKLLDDVEDIYQNLNFDIINLQCTGFLCTSFSNPKNVYVKNTKYVFVDPIYQLGAVGYIVSRKGIAKLTNFINNKVVYNIDFMLSLEKFIKGNIEYFYLNSPSVISTKSDNSDIVNMNSGGILNKSLSFFNLYNVKWYLNLPIFNIKLDTPISSYVILLLILIIMFLIYKKYIVALILCLELILVIRG